MSTISTPWNCLTASNLCKAKRTILKREWHKLGEQYSAGHVLSEYLNNRVLPDAAAVINNEEATAQQLENAIRTVNKWDTKCALHDITERLERKQWVEENPEDAAIEAAEEAEWDTEQNEEPQGDPWANAGEQWTQAPPAYEEEYPDPADLADGSHYEAYDIPAPETPEPPAYNWGEHGTEAQWVHALAEEIGVQGCMWNVAPIIEKFLKENSAEHIPVKTSNKKTKRSIKGMPRKLTRKSNPFGYFTIHTPCILAMWNGHTYYTGVAQDIATQTKKALDEWRAGE